MDVVGRDAERQLVGARVRDRRLVTLVGPGGIGKSTLARAVAAEVGEHFAEGVHVVDLSRVETADAVRESLAGQLGHGSFSALLDAPGDHPVLLVVDSCEHVVDAAAEAIGDLLDACDMPTVLATSRMALELPGEVVVPVGPLGLPPAGVHRAPAMDLFLQRAADAGVALEADEHVAELCRRLDGVPLAIELAAARTRSLAPADVLDRLVQGLDVLDRPRRRGARRHQSLRAAIAWSHDLLADDERALFDGLGVVAGPFTADLAHAVAGADGTSPAATQDLLDALVLTSMVAADTTGPTTTYRLLDTLRAFAREQLDAQGRLAAAEARLADHVVEVVGQVLGLGSGTFRGEALAELVGSYGHIAATIRWCIAHDESPDRAMLLAAVLWGVIHHAHMEEIGDLAERVLARWPDPDLPLRPDVVATAATARYMQSDHEGAIALATAALATADASAFGAVTLPRTLGQAVRATGATDEAESWFARTAAEARARGLVTLAVESDAARAHVLADVGRTDEALDLVRAAHLAAEADGSDIGCAWTRAIEGSILLRVDVAAARRVLAEAAAACEAIGYTAGTMGTKRSLALADLLDGELAGAARHLLALLDEILGRGSTYGLRMVLDVAAPVLARAGWTGPAADLAATALALPVMSITASVGHELVPVDPAGGSALPLRQAILCAREQLAEVGARVAVPIPAAPAAPPGRAGTFRRLGDTWEVGLGGTTATLKASKGLADIARLLAEPGREVHCLDLVGAGVEEGETGPVLDDAARRAYEQRVRDLQADLDAAEDANDWGRAERARAELDAVVDQLTAALGLGGRTRRAGGTAERARSTVTQRVRTTIRRIEDAHPALGRHLRASVRTGAFCAYAPEEPVDWHLGGDRPVG